MRKLLILRPDPGARETGARARAIGLDALLCPLFTVEPVTWLPPDPDRFDALLLTSANALRHGGPGLTKLARLPVIAVGEATAAAAREAGFTVAQVGMGGVAELLDALSREQRLLHLGGEDRLDANSRHMVEAVAVYRATPIADPPLPDLAGMVVLVHSPRAGARLAELVGDRSATAIVAISEAAARACGSGWEQRMWAERPGDSALLALAAPLCQSPPQ